MDITTLLDRAVRGEDVDADALGRWLLQEPGQAEVLGVTVANAAWAAAERLSGLPAVWDALGRATFDVAGHAETVCCPPRDLFLLYVPLAQMLAAWAGSCSERFLVGIAGPPAGGKSVFAAVLSRAVEALDAPFDTAIVGQDGYHYPNAYLAAHPAPDGMGQASLKLWKGAPFTFDAARLARDLARLRDPTAAVSLPAYDRGLHDPVEGAVQIRPEHRLVLVEGNYLLYREGAWVGIPDHFGLRVFLDVPWNACRGHAIARHMRGGRTREDAERHADRSDRANYTIVAATRGEADIVAELDERHGVRRLTGRR
jgi:pantothenate kinase